MKRTISVMVGKGSVSHNSRKFNAKNTDPERTPLNISYCNEGIREVYHSLFDEALERFNAKQTRADRRIDDYYEKICSGKQEKPFHEIILQIGNCDDTGATTDVGEQARAALDEYYKGFAERNPNLRVFSAHLHMDEATPHLHIDFVPYTIGSKRGLDTRVSLKQALAAQGFKGGSRQETEWNQWVQSEKEQLAAVMQRHGFEWEHKDTHEKHLSVLDYEKKMRSEEVAALEEKLAETKIEYNAATNRLQNFEKAEVELKDLQNKLETAPEYALPEPQTLMSAKSYKAKFAEPLIRKLKNLLISVLLQLFQAIDAYHRLNMKNGQLYRENEYLTSRNEALREENTWLKRENRDFALLKKVFGKEKIGELVWQAEEAEQAKKPNKRRRNTDYER